MGVVPSARLHPDHSELQPHQEKAIGTFSALGLSRRRIGRIFAWESIYVSLAGGLAGIALGLTLCLLQQHFGLITVSGSPETTIVRAYPVKVLAGDVLATLVPVALIGIATAAITAAFAKSRINIRN